MKKLPRILSLFLTFAMLAALLACTKNDGTGKQTTPPDDTTAPAADTEPVHEYEKDNLPDTLDFDGETVTFLTVSDNEWFRGEISVEELNNDIVNDSVYNRERFVEDRLNVEIETVDADESYSEIVIRQINAGEDNYQILSQRTRDLPDYIFLEYLLDLNDVENLDLDRPWWSQSFNEMSSILGRHYIATGALSLTLKRFLFAVFYNKKVAEDNSAAYPELTDLYSIVDSGAWTYDKFISLGGSLYQDLNGNSEADDEDYYGIGFISGIDIDTLWSSFDIPVFTKNDDDWFELTVDTDKCFEALEKISSLLHRTRGCYNPGSADNDLEKLQQKLAEDSVLFMVDRLYAAEQETLRNMQSDYGVLPFPKYDEEQENYYSHSHDQYTCFALPITVADTACAGAVLEAMASYSYRETEPAYLDLALKGKYMNDPESRQMIDLVVNGFKVDAAWIFIHSIALEFMQSFRNIVSENSGIYASAYATLERKINRVLGIYQKEAERMAES